MKLEDLWVLRQDDGHIVRAAEPCDPIVVFTSLVAAADHAEAFGQDDWRPVLLKDVLE